MSDDVERMFSVGLKEAEYLLFAVSPVTILLMLST